MEGLRERLSLRQLNGWIEYYKQHPFGDDWAQAATIAAAVINWSGYSRQGVKAERLIPRQRRRKQTAAELTAALDDFRRSRGK